MNVGGGSNIIYATPHDLNRNQSRNLLDEENDYTSLPKRDPHKKSHPPVPPPVPVKIYHFSQIKFINLGSTNSSFWTNDEPSKKSKCHISRGIRLSSRRNYSTSKLSQSSQPSSISYGKTNSKKTIIKNIFIDYDNATVRSR